MSVQVDRIFKGTNVTKKLAFLKRQSLKACFGQFELDSHGCMDCGEDIELSRVHTACKAYKMHKRVKRP